MSFRQQEIETENFTPRPYQLELLEKAKKENIIVTLSTGTGKTFIAVMLIRECAGEVRIPFEKGGKRSFFLVNTVNLVAQQAEEIRTHTDLKVGEYHGAMNVDRWTSDRWEKELTENHVFVMTAQIFLNIIMHGFFLMERANVIVFDECHHATGNHPYREIMRDYRNCPPPQPRILGLSASVIGEKTETEQLEPMMYKLESTLSAKVETSSELTSATKYGALPTIVTMKCRSFDDVQNTFRPVRLLLQKAVAFCKDADFNKDLEIVPTKPVIKALKRAQAILDQLGPWCAWRVCAIAERQLVKLDKYRMTEMEQLFILMGQTYLRVARQMLEPYVSGVDSLDSLLPWLPHRMHRLLECLRALNPRKREAAAKSTERTTRKDGKNKDDNEFAGIIFVEQRYVAKTLRDCLKQIQNYAKDDFGYLKIDFVVGFGKEELSEDDGRALRKRQEDVLKNFRQKNLNLLVSTTVLEEGVDVRQCNCVIRFDLPKNACAYIQSKGRARKQNSKYIMLVEEKEFEPFLAKYQKFVQAEEILQKHCRSRNVPPREDIDINFADHLLPPYFPPANDNEPMEGRPRVTMSTAIPLVNRYCAKLPSDVFTKLAPRYRVHSVIKNDTAYYQGSLILPINCPVKQEIFGPPMPKQKYAQMATALEACKILHQRQELDRHLLPVGKESAAKFLIEDDDEEWPTDGRVRPGSTKRKQYYAKKVADAFTNARPTSEYPCYVHVIEMELVKADGVACPSKRGQLSSDPSDYPRVWGILSKKPMPKIPSFPLFARQGELRVRIVQLPFTIQVDAVQLNSISRFHEYLFLGILRLEKYSMKYDPASAKSAVFIVPLKKVDTDGFVLDFPFVKNITGTGAILPHIPTEDERERFEFVRERYLDAVVMPWYRNPDQPYFYIVTEICDHLSPNSPFPDVEYASFNDYFMQKYGLHIYNQSQPMLDVDYTSSRLNLTLPRYVGRRAQTTPAPTTTETNAKSDPTTSLTQKQLLAPELVDVHPIPASMWNMIACLPTVLYRVNSLLIADEWRRRVEKDAFGRMKELPADFSWEPLTYGARHKSPSEAGIETADEDSTVDGAKQRPNAAANNAATEDETFEIGVWDPHLAAPVVDNTSRSTPPSVRPPNGLIVDQQGERRSETGNANDDDWDDEDELYFDVEMSQHFMSLERRARCGGVNGEVKFDDPFAPSANIVPTGWDAATNSVVGGSYENGTNVGVPGLSFLSSDGQFDANALLIDIATFGPNLGAPVTLAQETTRQPAAAALTTESVSNNAASSLIEDVWGCASTKTKLTKKSRNRAVDFSDFDDTDERRVEDYLKPEDLGIKDDGTNDDDGTRNPKKVSTKMKVCEVDSPMDGSTRPSSRCSGISDFETKNLIDFSDDECVDTSVNGLTTDEVFHSVDLRAIDLLNQSLPFDFEIDDFDTKSYGPSPCLILQALTMSNANDGINLERLETVGDSFLKYAVTSCLFNACPDFHEGKLSFLRSKHVSNYNLYKLGKRKGLGEIMITCKFEPTDNWLPPGSCPLEKDAENVDTEEDDKRMDVVLEAPPEATAVAASGDKLEVDLRQQKPSWPIPEEFAGIIPYNLLTQHSIPDKSIADAVEAMIGVYLLSYGPHKAVQFLKWLGVKPAADEETWHKKPRAPLLEHVKDPIDQLKTLWQRFNFSSFEHEIGYVFNDKAYLVQAFTHASYYYNRVTDCYQRLEFLGDAVLDYLITRHLFEDKRRHSPGILTDLRSALVNNTIFASLAVKFKFHKYFMALCPGMANLMTKFVRMIEERRQESNFDEELYLLNEEDCEDEEDIEVPKALGDMFESVAGAIYLDSGGSLNAVWRVYYRMMKDQIEKCCANPPKSPIRELLELEPEKAKFAKLERDVVECKVRVTVDIYGKGRFIGVGRNYRIAKCTAAKRALKYLKMLKAKEAKDARAK